MLTKYDDVPDRIPCCDCGSELIVAFGLLQLGKDRIMFFAHCETCRKRGSQPNVHAYSAISHESAKIAYNLGLPWVKVG